MDALATHTCQPLFPRALRPSLRVIASHCESLRVNQTPCMGALQPLRHDVLAHAHTTTLPDLQLPQVGEAAHQPAQRAFDPLCVPLGAHHLQLLQALQLCERRQIVVATAAAELQPSQRPCARQLSKAGTGWAVDVYGQVPQLWERGERGQCTREAEGLTAFPHHQRVQLAQAAQTREAGHLRVQLQRLQAGQRRQGRPHLAPGHHAEPQRAQPTEGAQRRHAAQLGAATELQRLQPAQGAQSRHAG